MFCFFGTFGPLTFQKLRLRTPTTVLTWSLLTWHPHPICEVPRVFIFFLILFLMKPVILQELRNCNN